MVMAALVSINMFVPLFFGGHWRPDFTFMWAGARAPDPYDIWAVTKAQAFMFDASKPLAFVYPPSSLPLFFPFGLLRFWPAYVVWSALSAVLFLWAARQVTDKSWLVFLTPSVLFSLYLGQTALMTGAAIIFGIVELQRRPVLAGVCFGVAAALKPQTVCLAPLALLVGRHWKTLAASALTWLLFALSAVHLWPAWWQVIKGFPAVLDRYYPYIANNGSNPVSFAKALGLPQISFGIAGIALGAGVIVASFRALDAPTRIVGLISGALLASPYAMKYETAAMAPAYIALLSNGRAKSLIIALPMFPINVVTMLPALVASSVANVLPLKPVQPARSVKTTSAQPA
jgi:hypothetical protein